MEGKESIKISLSTFFLIFAIIIICVLGYFTYNFYITKENLENEVANLKEENKQLINNNREKKDSNETIKNTTTDNTFDSISGVYTGVVDDAGNTEKVSLTLGKNATYTYNNVTGTGAGNSGYYTINENNIVLHALLINSNDPSVTIPNKTKIITLKINEDKSITDNNVNEVGLEATLKKSSTDTAENIDISSVLTEKHKANAMFFEIDR